jgi:hypothetical protein
MRSIDDDDDDADDAAACMPRPGCDACTLDRSGG